MKHLNNLTQFQLHKEGMRLRELINLHRHNADIAIQDKMGRKALAFLEKADSRFLELEAVNKLQDEFFKII